MAYSEALAVVDEHIKAGTLIGLCTAGKMRASTLPNMPTFPEHSYDVFWQVWLSVLA